jgi:hypothetical protein
MPVLLLLLLQLVPCCSPACIKYPAQQSERRNMHAVSMQLFRGSASSSLLALPRPSYCPSVGSYVALKAGEWPGPMAPCDYGIVLEDTGIGNTPYLVGDFTA